MKVSSEGFFCFLELLLLLTLFLTGSRFFPLEGKSIQAKKRSKDLMTALPKKTQVRKKNVRVGCRAREPTTSTVLVLYCIEPQPVD